MLVGETCAYQVRSGTTEETERKSSSGRFLEGTRERVVGDVEVVISHVDLLARKRLSCDELRNAVRTMSKACP